MHIPKVFRWLMVATVLVAIGGCASAYHDYAEGCVSFCHCWRPPLPYRTYCPQNVPLTDCDRTKDWEGKGDYAPQASASEVPTP